MGVEVNYGNAYQNQDEFDSFFLLLLIDMM